MRGTFIRSVAPKAEEKVKASTVAKGEAGEKQEPLLPAETVTHTFLFSSAADGQPCSHEVDVDHCKVTINGQPAKIEDIRTNDFVEFSGKPATSIFVTRTLTDGEKRAAREREAGEGSRNMEDKDKHAAAQREAAMREAEGEEELRPKTQPNDPGRPHETAAQRKERERRQGDNR